MKRGQSQERINNASHQHYASWQLGTGAQTEFAIDKTVQRLEQLMVTSEGKVLRPDADATTPYDYAVRGITPGYAGDANMVKIHTAPPAAANVGFFLNTD